MRRTADVCRFCRPVWLITAVSLILIYLSACAPPPAVPTYTYGPMEGIASWYGDDFHGRKTSSGERYNMYKLTAASKTIPLGSRVKVTRLDNGKSVVVKINDRGPFIEGRIIDLSYKAAQKVDMIEGGVAPVKLTILSVPGGAPAAPGKLPPEAPPSMVGRYWIQVGSFSLRNNADRLRERLLPIFGEIEIQTVAIGDRNYHRVRIGPYSIRSEAQSDIERLAGRGYGGIIAAEEPY